jgi:hypothetical protein
LIKSQRVSIKIDAATKQNKIHGLASCKRLSRRASYFSSIDRVFRPRYQKTFR